ncbi:MAG: hypothetical protein AVDCRST_MAG18-4603 [uncultured Thermomicrobiales bacterium]|uniref:Uncharacterized protein n=1 Tax=uncultured Thermomicrobiales bacterium TaxID=1645740 RepID=A0A6J4VVK9_9BACT|nr:MAG: hypothetical protein AVDCRST_MAG18-4603 [uncultured Thermomicrobiales bacterium]
MREGVSAATLAHVFRDIADRARFTPSKRDPLHQWWTETSKR